MESTYNQVSKRKRILARLQLPTVLPLRFRLFECSQTIYDMLSITLLPAWRVQGMEKSLRAHLQAYLRGRFCARTRASRVTQTCRAPTISLVKTTHSSLALTYQDVTPHVPSLTTRYAARILSFGLWPRQESHSGVWNAIFEDSSWINQAIVDFKINPVLIGQNLHNCVNCNNKPA